MYSTKQIRTGYVVLENGYKEIARFTDKKTADKFISEKEQADKVGAAFLNGAL